MNEFQLNGERQFDIEAKTYLNLDNLFYENKNKLNADKKILNNRIHNIEIVI